MHGEDENCDDKYYIATFLSIVLIALSSTAALCLLDKWKQRRRFILDCHFASKDTELMTEEFMKLLHIHVTKDVMKNRKNWHKILKLYKLIHLCDFYYVSMKIIFMLIQTLASEDQKASCLLIEKLENVLHKGNNKEKTKC